MTVAVLGSIWITWQTTVSQNFSSPNKSNCFEKLDLSVVHFECDFSSSMISFLLVCSWSLTIYSIRSVELLWMRVSFHFAQLLIFSIVHITAVCFITVCCWRELCVCSCLWQRMLINADRLWICACWIWRGLCVCFGGVTVLWLPPGVAARVQSTPGWGHHTQVKVLYLGPGKEPIFNHSLRLIQPVNMTLVPTATEAAQRQEKSVKPNHRVVSIISLSI